MGDWSNMNDRKSKKNKKKQTASISEPVDLEAGEHLDESAASGVERLSVDPVDTPVIPNAYVVPKSSEGDTVTEVSTRAASKDSIKTTKTPIPPPPKTKLKTTGRKNTGEIVQTYGAVSRVTDSSMSGPSKAKMADNPESRDADKNPLDSNETTNPDPPKTKITSKKAKMEATQDDELASKFEDLGTSGSSKAETVKGDRKGELRIVPLVCEWSIDPELPKKTNSNGTVAAAGNEQNETLSVIDHPLKEPHMTKADQSKETILPGTSIQGKVTSDVDSQSSTAAGSKTATSIGLPPLPPFDHRTFSRVNNIPQRNTHDRGPKLKVQTDKNTFVTVHESVLCQSSKYFQYICGPAYVQVRQNSRELFWSSSSSFKGVTSTYIHWLYNGNLPTAVIDVSDNTKVGAVLLGLAKEYVLGSKIVDAAYRNAIMDHFITIHVRMRKLSFGSVIDVVYEGTYEGSPMRQLLADMHAFIVVDDIEKLDIMDSKPKVFVEDVLKSVLTIRPNEVDEWWFYLETKAYHR